ncbi:hypothetical protein [Azospirillum sp.]|uniref:hypothetical protein n=1 Tax=Azospirillum sp. TaxID=34012 RepID=UPI002D339A71|nr:hypothetical protein [Azospirillum sp.]HYD65968.1 hypothetical protein [Azospirillum sp.]
MSKAFATLALSLAAMAAAPSGALAQSGAQGTVCVQNDTRLMLTGFRLEYYSPDTYNASANRKLGEAESGIFPVYQTRCIDVPAQINGTPVAMVHFSWNYNAFGVAWSDWRPCNNQYPRPAKGNHKFAIKMMDVGYIDCFAQ